MHAQLSEAINKSSQVFVETLNSFELFTELPYLLNCQKPVYCTSSWTQFVKNGYRSVNRDVSEKQLISGFLSESDQFEPPGVNVIYVTTDILVQRILTYLAQLQEGIDLRWFCSVIIISVSDIIDDNYQIITNLLNYYDRYHKIHPASPKPPKTIFLGKQSHLDQTVSMPIHNITIRFDKTSDRFSVQKCFRAVELAGQFSNQTVTIITPDDKHAGIIYNNISALSKRTRSVHKLSSDSDLHNIIDHDLTKIVICTVDTVQYLKRSQVVIDLLTAPQKYSRDIVTNQLFRSITCQESIIHQSLASDMYIPLCSENQYYLLPKEIEQNTGSKALIETVPETGNLSLEKQILTIQMHGLSAEDLLEDVRVSERMLSLKKYRILNHKQYLTNAGHFCLKFPLDIRQSMMIYYLGISNDPHIFLHLCVLCTINSYENGIFKWPKRTDNETLDFLETNDKISYFESKFAGYSDVTTLYNIWIKICQTTNPFYYNNLKSFCKKYCLNFYCFKSAMSLIKRCQAVASNRYYNIRLDFDLNRLAPQIDSEEISKKLYKYLVYTHPENKATVSYTLGRVALECNGVMYELNDKSIHSMHVGRDINQVFYILSCREFQNRGKSTSIATVLHAITDGDCDSVMSSELD